MFRTRFAPSPTGYLHLGGARQAIFTKLFSVAKNGRWFIRLEDTDQKRYNPDSASNLVNSLKQLGLNPDEGVNGYDGQYISEFKVFTKGEYGPYIQSQRLDLYHNFAQDLIDKKLAYWSYLTDSDIEELKDIKKASKKAIDYFLASQKKNPDKLFQSVKDGLADELNPVIRFRINSDEIFETTDLLAGKTKFDLSLEEDFIILKSDGFASYHLAHIVDDHSMKTSLILRSKEWYPSIVKHQYMFKKIYDYMPDYLHVPYILGSVGNTKMSKRNGDVNLGGYLDRGFLPEALVNYLVFLGWNPGHEKELYLEPQDFYELNQQDRLEKLYKNISLEFGLEKLASSPARFNIEKLIWFNKEYIKMLRPQEFFELSLGILKQNHNNTDSGVEQNSYFDKLISGEIENSFNLDYICLTMVLDQQRVGVLSESFVDSSCILDYTKPKESDLAWKNMTPDLAKHNLNQILEFISGNIYNSDFESNRVELLESALTSAASEKLLEISNNIEKTIKEYIKVNNLNMGEFLWPLRVALSGKVKSPSPFELLAILDFKTATKRIMDLLEG